MRAVWWCMLVWAWAGAGLAQGSDPDPWRGEGWEREWLTPEWLAWEAAAANGTLQCDGRFEFHLGQLLGWDGEPKNLTEHLRRLPDTDFVRNWVEPKLELSRYFENETERLRRVCDETPEEPECAAAGRLE